MKHGKKASKGHAKASKETLKSKAGAGSGKKVAPKGGKEAVKPLKAVKGKAEDRAKGGGKAIPKAIAKAVAKIESKAVKASAPAVAPRGASGGAPPPAAPAAGKADTRGKAPADGGGLRPDTAAAFQRVLKKYPDALRRLAD